MITAAHRWTLVMASVAKWALQGEMPAKMRLEFLGRLEQMTDGVLTPEIIAIVEPMDAKGFEIYDAAKALGYGRDGHGANLFTVLDKKFDVFATLNPSVRAAYEAMSQGID
jgi:hypothetical protein